MAASPVQRQLRQIQFLLILVVSFLGGLVFGRDYSTEAGIAVLFSVLGLTLLLASEMQSRSSE
jgi:hypothetical protein